MNAELVKQALAKVLNPHVLVNLVSRRVRQLNAGGWELSGPLVTHAANLRVADIALREIIEDKIRFDLPEILELTRPTGKNGRRPSAGWHLLKKSGATQAAPTSAHLIFRPPTKCMSFISKS